MPPRSPYTSGPLRLVLILLGIGACSCLENWTRTEPPAPSRWSRSPYDTTLRAASRRYLPATWDWRILKALTHQESHFRVKARSPVGARGICQIMPETAGDLGLSPEELDDPEVNIDAAARYLRQLWDSWPQLPDGPPHWTRSRFALACYNGGRRRVHQIAEETGARNWQQLAPHLPAETRDYVGLVFDELHPGYASGGTPRPGFRNSLR